MIKKITRKLFTVVSVVVLTTITSCSDDLFDFNSRNADEDGISFGVTTEEMGHEVVNTGSTRAAANTGTPSESDRFLERTLEGDNPFGLKMHREPLPLMGFNPGAVRVPASVGEPAILSQAHPQEDQTRAGANEVVLAAGTNFHDSLTIWGYTDNGTELFNQIILTKVRNWRNSVEWPYNQGNYMRFYAVAPSLESINMSATGGSYATAPTLTYTLPENVNEMVDVLYGESENISIDDGPAGSVTTDPKNENLGKDNKFVDMRFRHILTAIRFSQGTIPDRFIIKSISLNGVYIKATYNPATTDPSTNTSGNWNGHTTNANYTIYPEFTGTGISTSNTYIDKDTVLFMIPQTLPAGAEIRVTLTDTQGTASTADDKDHTLTCAINGDIWKKGYTVNYRLTIGRLVEGYYFTVQASKELEHNTNAVSGTINVDSYQLFYDYSSGTGVPTYTPVTWSIDGYSINGDAETPTYVSAKPSSLSWLTDFRGVQSGSYYEGGYGASASYTVAGQEMALSTSHDVVLSGNTTASSLDLSTHYPYGGDAHSSDPANCYIVNRIGGYTFPLVYGNMTADNASQPACFKDHTGATITRRLIKEQMEAKNPADYTVTEANVSRNKTSYTWDATTNGTRQTLRVVLLWQDVNGFISSIGLTTTAISFNVGASVPANAVIALQGRKETVYEKSEDSGVNWSVDTSQGTNGYTYGDWETLWTWHIWMTDEVYKNDGTENGASYDTYYLNGTTSGTGDHDVSINNGTTTTGILPVNLGWVPDEDNFGLYKKREAWVKLKQTQTTSEKTAVVKITQHARQELYTGTGTVYQWGRPTAFPALRTVNGTLRTIYDIDGNDITSQFVLAQATNGGDAISNPFGVLQWQTNANSWFDVSSGDYATANAMWNSTKKTVYDPCPPGFRVPPVSIFTGFSKTGETVQATAGQLNMWPEGTDGNGVTQKSGERTKGGYFYCTPHTGVIPATDRYGTMVYMPATGEWHGNKTVGTQLQESTEQLNQTNGIFWTSDYNNDGSSQACFLWITPDNTFSAGTADKPVIGFFDTSHKKNYYNNLRGIRPMVIP